MPTNLPCLTTLDGRSGTKEIEPNLVTINELIGNFKKFYEDLSVPEGKIFLSGVVSAKKIQELCTDVEFLNIQMAKGSTNADDLSDFTFIISQSDKSADIIPENQHFGLVLDSNLLFNEIPNFKPKFMDACCCRNPPGTE